MKLPETAKNRLEDALKQLNLRPTQQREHVFAVLLSERDHPTADEVYVRAKKKHAKHFTGNRLQLSGDSGFLQAGQTGKF